MPDPFYPTVDSSFLLDLILKCGKIIPESVVKVGDTTAFLTAGDFKAIYKRYKSFTELTPGEVVFEIATGLAIELRFMGPLLSWYETNKNWKDGGYFVP